MTRLAGAEHGSRVLQNRLNHHCARVRAAKHTSRGPFNLLEQRQCLAEIVERGGGVPVERHRIILHHRERQIKTISEDTSRHGDIFAQQRLAFFEALQSKKGRRVIVGCQESLFMFLAVLCESRATSLA